jgi:hypothetical protein
VAAQLDLLAGLPAPPRPGSLEELVERARAFVDQVKSHRVCQRCCSDERLMFVHQQPSRWNVPVWKLVESGASIVRIREEITRCDVICRRCWVSGTHPKMLRARRQVSVPIVAKAPTTTHGGENVQRKGRSKGANWRGVPRRAA